MLEVFVRDKNKKPYKAICLSDDGSTLNFIRSKFLEETGLHPIGMWQGCIKTIYECVAIESPLYKITFNKNQHAGGTEDALVISTQDIGHRDKVNQKLMKGGHRNDVQCGH